MAETSVKDETYYLSLDKRSKEYKEWNESKGLGDTIEKITEATGIKKAVDILFKDCGCNEKKEWLNRKFPYYNSIKKCMTQEQYEDYKDFKDRDVKELVDADQQLIHSMYNSVFAVNTKPCNGCSASQWRTFISRLDVVFEEYEQQNNN